MRKNVSNRVKNGTVVKVRDSHLEHGRNTKNGNDYRSATVIDSNRKHEIALLKRQHAKDGLKLGNETFNPHIKTRDNKGKPLKIDGVKVIKTKKSISTKDANELKRQALKDMPKNTRKPNRKRLKELKGRK